MLLSTTYLYCPYDGSRMDVPNPGFADGGRARCANCGFVDFGNPLPCVTFFICNADRVLIGRRASEPAKGKWDVLGGFINPGESAEAAVLREAMEETNLRVEIVAYLGSAYDVYGDRQFPTLNLIYLVRAESDEMNAQSDVAELKWFTVDTIPADMAFAHQQQAVQLLRKYLRTNGVESLR